MQPYQMNGMAPYYGNYYGVPYPYAAVNYVPYPSVIPVVFKSAKKRVEKPTKSSPKPLPPPVEPPPVPHQHVHRSHSHSHSHSHPHFHPHYSHSHHPHLYHHHHHLHQHDYDDDDDEDEDESDRDSANRKYRYIRNNASQTTPTLLLDPKQMANQEDDRVITPSFIKETLNSKPPPKRLTPDFLQEYNDAISTCSTPDQFREDSPQVVGPKGKGIKGNDPPVPPPTNSKKNNASPVKTKPVSPSRKAKDKR